MYLWQLFERLALVRVFMYMDNADHMDHKDHAASNKHADHTDHTDHTDPTAAYRIEYHARNFW